jgi:phenylpropionate dioxygenase-like ring-hydroxylating dioxygenase large terminal subunit
MSTEVDGRAYGRPAGIVDEDLASVGPGTPGGELLRRYWHPVALSEEATNVPRSIRVLGEDLILFRDGTGNPGLVTPRCVHRGTTLLYGKVEDVGIRCCYHGWLFDSEGNCLDQPCEPERGQHRERFRQPWYPVKERYGLVFAYLGPADRQPALPRYDIFEDLAPGEQLVANGDSIGSGGPPLMHCNWFQTHENVMDPYHVFILHGTFSSTQFTEIMNIFPDITWDFTDYGVRSFQDRRLPDGSLHHRVTELVMPNIRVVADPRVRSFTKTDNVSWTLPIDETTTRIFAVFRMGPDDDTTWPSKVAQAPMYDGKSWYELDDDGHQRYPGDYEAQVGQGAVTLHSEEHLAASDRGVLMFRTLYKRAIKAVASGEDPPCAWRDEADALVRLQAGNFLIETTSATT